MEVEKEELLAKSHCSQQLREAMLGFGTNPGPVEEDCEARVDEEGQGDLRVLKVVEMVRGDGAVHVEGLVTSRADEELHRHGHRATGHDREELQVPPSRGGEPWKGLVGAWVEGMELDVVEEVP